VSLIAQLEKKPASCVRKTWQNCSRSHRNIFIRWAAGGRLPSFRLAPEWAFTATVVPVAASPGVWDQASAEGEPMPKDDRNLLDVLKFELEFLETGGYGRLSGQAWRPRFIFEDSPTCVNFSSEDKDREPCSECLLMQFVPEDARTQQVPCIHISLSRTGETIASLYSTGTQQEREEALGAWLRATIRRLEEEKAKQAASADLPAV
jgi:hypothetical protein